MKLDTRTLLKVAVGIIFGLAILPALGVLVSGAQTYTYTTYQTLNTGFSENTVDVPDNWDNIVTDNRVAYWSTNNYIYENGDNGTVYWHQSLAVTDLSDGVSSATIVAKFRLKDNDALTSFTARVLLDNGTDNIVIWESTSTENSASYTSIENNVSSYITATGTYYIRLFDNVAVTNDNNIEVRWDDVSLTTVIQAKVKTVAQTMVELIPLFFIIGMIIAISLIVTKDRR